MNRTFRNNKPKVSLSKEESEKIQYKAEKLGMKLATYMRFVSLNANIEIDLK